MPPPQLHRLPLTPPLRCSRAVPALTDLCPSRSKVRRVDGELEGLVVLSPEITKEWRSKPRAGRVEVWCENGVGCGVATAILGEPPFGG